MLFSLFQQISMNVGMEIMVDVCRIARMFMAPVYVVATVALNCKTVQNVLVRLTRILMLVL